MANRSHRWPADDTPLTGKHGGTKEAALRALMEAQGRAPAKARPKPKNLAERERAVEIARRQLDQLISKLPPVTRKDRLRPRAEKPTKATPEERRSMLREHYARQEGKCAYCKALMNCRPIDAEKWRVPTLDHVVAVSKGGHDTLANTVAACRGCNQAKGSLSVEEFMANRSALRRQVGAA